MTLPSFAEFYQQGGGFMHAISLTSLVGGIVVMERAWQLVVRQRLDAPRLHALVQGRLLAGDTAAAVRLCASDCAVARVMRAGLMAGVDRWRAEGAVKEEQMAVMPLLTRRLPLLSSLASIASLLGLLGTIFALIPGFVCVATVSADQRAAALSHSISLAINTTGFGLLVATALVAARLWLQTTGERLVAEVALYGAKVVNLVTVATEAPALAPGTPYRTID